MGIGRASPGGLSPFPTFPHSEIPGKHDVWVLSCRAISVTVSVRTRLPVLLNGRGVNMDQAARAWI